MNKKILIVDDELDMLQLLKRSLGQDLKCRVVTASSGKNALELISHQAFDLVLADIKMPEMNGLELLELRHCRRTHVRAGVEVPVPVGYPAQCRFDIKAGFPGQS